MSQSLGGLKLRQTRQSRGLDEPRPTDVGPPGSLPQRRDFRLVLDDAQQSACLLYTSDAADERSRADPGGRRIIKKKDDVTS